MEIINHSVKVLQFTQGIGELIESATRTCYNSFDRVGEGSAEKLYNQVVKQHHHDSVSEHGTVSFAITTSRDIMAQITRHRMASYSVQSQRYCNYTKGKFGGIKFIAPLSIDVNDYCDPLSLFNVWDEAMAVSERFYNEMIKRGCKPEVARSVLPNSTATDMVMTVNVRSLRNFLNLRLDNHAQAEIKHIANLMVEALKEANFPMYLISDVKGVEVD